MKSSISTYLGLAVLLLIDATCLAKTTTVSKQKFIQRLANNSSNFTTLLCEGLYASQQTATYLEESRIQQSTCYALMHPLVQRGIQEITKNASPRLNQHQQDSLRDQIATYASQNYLKQHISVPRTIHFDNFGTLYPKIFCQHAHDNPSLRALVAHMTQQQCIATVTPIVNDCMQKYQQKMPANMSYELLNRSSYLIGTCTSTKFVDHYLKQKKV